MRPSGILHLYRIRIRARLGQELFATVGIAAGVALLFAAQVANTSLNGSVHQLTSGLVGQSQLQLAARDPNGFDESLLASVRALPGVRSAAPIIEAQANVIGPRSRRRSVDFIGADPRFVTLGGTLLQHFSAAALARQHAIALPAPTAQAIGATELEPVRLQIGESTTRVLLGSVLQEAEIGSLAHSPVALAPLRYAQLLAGMSGRVTRIFIRSAPGARATVEAELHRLAGDQLNVEPADYDATLFDSAAMPTNQSTTVFALISALVGFILAFDAILLTVPARRRFVADLKLDGYGPRTVIEVMLVDALALGVVACLLGLALGDELSLRLFHASPGYLSFAFPVGSQRIVTWQAVTVAVLGGLIAACAGVFGPMREDLFSDLPLAPRRGKGRAVSARLLPLGGALCLVVTTLVLVLAPRDALVGIGTLTLALLLLLPILIRGVVAATSQLAFDVRARAPSVAVAELRSAWARTVGIAATGAIAVFGSVAIQGAHADLQRGLDRSARDVAHAASIWAFPPGLSNLLATTPFRPSALPQLARLPGVRDASLYRGGFLDYRDRRVWVSAPPLSQRQLVPPHQLVEGDLAFADARLRDGGWAVISKAIAEEHGLHIGDSFVLPAPRPTRFRVAALSTNIGWPPGAIVINADDYASAWGSNDASAYEITTAPGAPASLVAGEVRRALGPSSGLTVQTASEREARQRAASRQGLSRLTQISVLVLIAAILAMGAAMGSMISQRRPRLASLKLDGFSDLDVWRALLLETVLLVGFGCAIGALFGLYGQVLGSHTILSVTGFPVVFVLGVLGAVESFGLVTLVAVAITAVPGYLAARVEPAAHLVD
ncbi:MAG TPA: FtsX-like permease family protein [Solirubrobacteraceae bacterium]|jgi:putative ABC transport system permease protein|nr:FtsX-like permease family protein [Solirubrobacteraceae bacterium]